MGRCSISTLLPLAPCRRHDLREAFLLCEVLTRKALFFPKGETEGGIKFHLSQRGTKQIQLLGGTAAKTAPRRLVRISQSSIWARRPNFGRTKASAGSGFDEKGGLLELACSLVGNRPHQPIQRALNAAAAILIGLRLVIHHWCLIVCSAVALGLPALSGDLAPVLFA